MKINLFKVPVENSILLKEKFEQVGLNVVSRSTQGPWNATLYFSSSEEPTSAPWIEDIKELLGNTETYKNLAFYGAYLFETNDKCFVVSFGKAHFYIRNFCDSDFGIEVAKRIADEENIKQVASKRFAGKKKKEIKSYANNSGLGIESGESVDLITAAIDEDHKETYGRTGKFGSSLLLNPIVTASEIGNYISGVADLLEADSKFDLPRTVRLSDEDKVAEYDQALIQKILGLAEDTDVISNSHDLVGVDFVFSGDESYTLRLRGYPSKDLDDLTIEDLREYIVSNNIPREQILAIKIKINRSDRGVFTRKLKESLDCTIEGENIVLAQGKWVAFNEDYLDQLNESVDSIEIEETELEFKEIAGSEIDFNSSEIMHRAGYELADRNFSIIQTRSVTPIEAWDLRKGNTVYAVKIGPAQKLGYVCSQSMAVLELIKNNANLKKLDAGINNYCLWLVFDLVNPPQKLSQSKSIILKQQIEAWARKCRELGITPKLKISKKISN